MSYQRYDDRTPGSGLQLSGFIDPVPCVLGVLARDSCHAFSRRSHRLLWRSRQGAKGAKRKLGHRFRFAKHTDCDGFPRRPLGRSGKRVGPSTGSSQAQTEVSENYPRLSTEKPFHLFDERLALFDDLLHLIRVKMNQRSIIGFLPVIKEPVLVLSQRNRNLPSPHEVPVEHRANLSVLSECLAAL
jgi:hypothetical protein